MTKLVAATLTASVLAIAAFAAAGTSAAAPAQSADGSEEHRPDRSRCRPVQDARHARQARGPRRRSHRPDEADRLRTDGRRLQDGAQGNAEQAAPQPSTASPGTALPRRRGRREGGPGGRAPLGQDPRRAIRADQDPRRERLPQRLHAGREDRHRGVERHDSRHQQGSPPAGTVEPRSPVSANGRPPGRPRLIVACRAVALSPASSSNSDPNNCPTSSGTVGLPRSYRPPLSDDRVRVEESSTHTPVTTPPDSPGSLSPPRAGLGPFFALRRQVGPRLATAVRATPPSS